MICVTQLPYSHRQPAGLPVPQVPGNADTVTFASLTTYGFVRSLGGETRDILATLVFWAELLDGKSLSLKVSRCGEGGLTDPPL